MEKSSLKYQVLADMLRARINSLPAGSKLPSLRALKRRMGYSIQTIYIAINLLEREGLLVRKHGSGLYVSKKEGVRHIAFCRTNYPSVNGQIKENGLREACTRKGWTLSTYHFLPAYKELLLDHEIHADAVVVFPEIINYEYGISKVLLASKIPIVVLGRDTSSIGIDSVTGDDDAAMILLLKKLMALGHTRIAFLKNEPQCYEVDQKASSFRYLTSVFDLEDCQVIDCGTQSGQDSGLAAYHTMQELASKHPKGLPFTALIGCSSPGTYTAIRALHEHGWRVTEDYSAICMQEDPMAAFMTPSVTNLKWNYMNWGIQCVELLEKRLLGQAQGVQSLKLVPDLNIRESIAPPPNMKKAPSKAVRESRKRSPVAAVGPLA